MARNAQAVKSIALGAGIKPIEWLPVLVIPVAPAREVRVSRGATRKAETDVRVRYEGTCASHKSHVGLKDLESPKGLEMLCNRLSAHYGHGALLPAQAHVVWERNTEAAPLGCPECMDEVAAKKSAA